MNLTVEEVVEAVEQQGGIDVRVIDLKGKGTGMGDAFVFCTCTTQLQMRRLSDMIVHAVRGRNGVSKTVFFLGRPVFPMCASIKKIGRTSLSKRQSHYTRPHHRGFSTRREPASSPTRQSNTSNDDLILQQSSSRTAVVDVHCGINDRENFVSRYGTVLCLFFSFFRLQSTRANERLMRN